MNSFTEPYPILSQDAATPTTGQSTGGGMLGNDGFLSKAGETFIDLVGLYGEYDIKKRSLKIDESQKNPEIQASQARARILPQVIVDNRVPIYIVGGIAVVGILAAITIAASRKK